MNNRCLVIGANGFLGRELLMSFAFKDVDGVHHNNTANLPPGYQFYSSSEFDKLSIDYGVVYLVAAYIPKDLTEQNKVKLEESNVQLAEKVVRKFVNSKIVFASSVSVYGNVESEITELTSPLPNSDYGKSKLVAENIIMNAKAYSILRISSIYGIGMTEKTFIPVIVNQALRNNRITLRGNGERVQNYIQVYDVVRCLKAGASLSKNACLLAVNDVSYSNKIIAHIVKSELVDVEIIYEGEDKSCSFAYNSKNSWERLGIESMKDIKLGLKEYIQWKRKQS